MTKAIISFLLVLLVGTLHAQHKLSIQINDAHEKGIAHVTLQLSGARELLLSSDAQGRVVFENLPSGTYRLKTSHLAYVKAEKTISLNQDRQLTFSLHPQSLVSESVFVYATRAKQNASTTFRNIDQQEIQRRNMGQDLPYLLDQTPSVVVGSDAGNGIGYTSLTIRGSKSERINVTLDGIPLNDAESMGSFFINLPDFASSTQSIQVQRGIGTSTNGAGAFGASINIQSDALTTEPYAAINTSYGSYKALKSTIKAGTGLIDNKYAFNTRLSRITSDGYIDRASANLQSFFVDGAYYGDKKTLKATLFSGKQKTYQAWYGTPEPLITGERHRLEAYADAMELYSGPERDRLLQADRTYNKYSYEDQTDNYTQTHAHLHYNQELSEKITFNVALHYTRGAGYFEEYRPDEAFEDYGMTPIPMGKDSLSSSDLIRRRWLDNHFYGSTYSLQYALQENLNITLGGGWNQYQGDHYGQVIWANYASNTLPNDKYYLNKGQKNDFNSYIKADYNIGRWLLNLDLQYRNIHYRIAGDDDVLKNLQVHDDLAFFNPKAGLTYRINERSNAYLSYALAHKEPVRNDYVENHKRGFPAAERMHNIETGYRINQPTLTIGANVYAMLYKNQLIPTGALNDVGATIRQNVEDSYRLGLEVDGSWRISKAFRWSATAALSANKIRNYTEQIALYDENWKLAGMKLDYYEKTNIALSPSVILSNELTYALGENLRFALSSKYVSRQYLDNTSHKARSIKGYTTSNWSTHYDFTALGIKNIGLHLAVNNLFNKMYETSGYTWGSIDSQGEHQFYNFYTPQAGTHVMMGVNLSF